MDENYFMLRSKTIGGYLCVDEGGNFFLTQDKARADQFCEHVVPSFVIIAGARLKTDFRLVRVKPNVLNFERTHAQTEG